MQAHERRMIKLAGGGLAAAFLLAGLYLTGGGLYIKAKAVVAQILLERAWAETVATGQIHKAWPWADTWPVALLEAPGLNKRAVVLSGGSSGEAMAFGPGHLDATPEPGETGVAILSGHRDTHFRFLKDLEPDDEVQVTGRDGTRHRFLVKEARVVRWDHSGIDIGAKGRRLALVTCYPFDALGRGPLRYVVFAELTDELALSGHE